MDKISIFWQAARQCFRFNPDNWDDSGVFIHIGQGTVRQALEF